MNSETKTLEPVALAIRKGRSSIVLGDELIFGPRAEFEVVMDPNDSSAARLAHVQEEMAGAEAREMLKEAANIAAARANRLSGSVEAWAQAGFAFLASDALMDAQSAFEHALSIAPEHRMARMGLSRVLQQRGLLEEALSVLEQLRGEHPSDLEVLVAYAIILVNLERADEASALLAQRVPVSPRSALFFATRGSLKVAQGDYNGGIADLRKAVRLKPDWVAARNVLGIAEFKAGQWKAARQRFQEAMRLGPLHQESFENLLRIYLAERNYSDIRRLVKAQFSFANAPAIPARIAGRAALEQEDWNEAKRWLESAAQKTDDRSVRASLINDIGVTLSRLGRHSEALKQFDQAYQLLDSPLFAVNKAKSYIDAGQPYNAVTWLRTLGDFPEPYSYEARKTLANALIQARMDSDAIGIAEPLLADKRADANLYAMLTAAYSDWAGNLDAAIDLAERGLVLFPDDVTLKNNLAYALLQRGSVDEAAAILQMIPSDEDTTRSYLTATRGLLALWRGDIALGRQLYERAMARAKDDRERGRIRVKRDLEIARALLRLDGSRLEAGDLLLQASRGDMTTGPYNLHAAAELKRLTGSR